MNSTRDFKFSVFHSQNFKVFKILSFHLYWEGGGGGGVEVIFILKTMSSYVATLVLNIQILLGFICTVDNTL